MPHLSYSYTHKIFSRQKLKRSFSFIACLALVGCASYLSNDHDHLDIAAIKELYSENTIVRFAGIDSKLRLFTAIYRNNGYIIHKYIGLDETNNRYGWQKSVDDHWCVDWKSTPRSSRNTQCYLWFKLSKNEYRLHSLDSDLGYKLFLE